MIRSNDGVVINEFDWSGSYSFDMAEEMGETDIFRFVINKFKDKIPAPVCEGEYSQLRLNIPKQIVHEVSKCIHTSELVTAIDVYEDLHKRAVYHDSISGAVYCGNVRFELCTYESDELPGDQYDITLSFDH